MRQFLLAISLFFSTYGSTWHYDEGHDSPDSYGPSKWYKLPDAQLCGHTQQSPIEINPSNFIFDSSCSSPLQWIIHPTVYNLTVSHTGHDGHTLLINNTLASSNIYLNSTFQHHNHSQQYTFDSFHIHWGPSSNNGSEHIYTGTTTTLEIHFLHFSTHYASVSDAITAWNNAMYSDDPQIHDLHTLAQIGVLFEEVLDDETYNTKADHIIRLMATDPSMHNVWRNATESAYLQFAITDLFDADDLLHHYYHYHGSLTTPPCTPGVAWYLARNTIKIRRSTMELFRQQTKLWKRNGIDADSNFRPLQTNPSCIWICDDEQVKWCPQYKEDVTYPQDYWNYIEGHVHGPSDWVNVEGGQLCGHPQQSPILIDPQRFDTTRGCQQRLQWDVDDTDYNWTVTHKGEDGHTIEFFNENAKSNVWLSNAWQIPGNKQHPRYNLKSIHVHWGPDGNSGSEHVYKGVSTTFEIHFVHYSNDYVSLGEALAAWEELSQSFDPQHNDPYTLAKTAFLYQEVDDTEPYNIATDRILRTLATDEEMNRLWRNETSAAYISFSIKDLVDVSDLERNYYYYEGSLTTPPCTPAVRWHLAKHTILIRKSTMDLFRSVTKKWGYATGVIDADRNFRPIQSNPNCIFTCGDRWCPEEEGIDYPDWHYKEDLWDGPSNWWKINKLCSHPQQSPILMDPDNFAQFGSCDTPLEWNVDDTVYDWTVTHQGESGHTLYVSNNLAKHNIHLRNSFMLSDDQHERYKLYALHFHWGPGSINGSEHIYKGRTTTFEAHFVHFSDDFISVGAAVNNWAELAAFEGRDMHTLGVIGFLFEEVDDTDVYNKAADGILLQFATDDGMQSVWNTANGTASLSFAITDLVDVAGFQRNYYHYWGSLTTPPCTPAVSWHLARDTIKVRKYTMDLFREKTKLWAIAAGAVDADRNFRPVQSNPSCISVCGGNENMQYCGEEEEEKDNTWIWVSIGIGSVVLLIIVVVVYYLWKKKKNRNTAPLYRYTSNKKLDLSAIEQMGLTLEGYGATDGK